MDLRLAPEDLPRGRATVRFGLVPMLDEAHTREVYAPVAAHLGGVLGVPVELVVATSYQDLMARLGAGEVEVAQLPPLSYVLARREHPDLVLLASALGFGATSYSAFVIVRADDRATRLTDLAGRRISFVDPASTSGHLFAYAALLDHGLDPREDFADVRFAGSHLEAIRDVRTGRSDAAATASGMLGAATRTMGHGEAAGVDVRILFKAGRIPYDALSASPLVPPSGVEKLKWAFVGLSTRTSRGRAALRRTDGTSGWVPAEDADYDGVRDVLARVERHRGPLLPATGEDTRETERATGVLGP